MDTTAIAMVGPSTGIAAVVFVEPEDYRRGVLERLEVTWDASSMPSLKGKGATPISPTISRRDLPNFNSTPSSHSDINHAGIR